MVSFRPLPGCSETDFEEMAVNSPDSEYLPFSEVEKLFREVDGAIPIVKKIHEFF